MAVVAEISPQDARKTWRRSGCSAKATPMQSLPQSRWFGSCASQPVAFGPYPCGWPTDITSDNIDKTITTEPRTVHRLCQPNRAERTLGPRSDRGQSLLSRESGERAKLVGFTRSWPVSRMPLSPCCLPKLCQSFWKKIITPHGLIGRMLVRLLYHIHRS